ncbi:hypothetical protein C8A01DRAFT_33220 [Parachaetomium inaequale]|uniref:Uncharacterized protein n=1 Tax=Parachaetomium inaequale TaxID=2588326 RepID=A0AAN6PKX2_9PEZI|nr:hypothetical protein C8A01DRAFT_33220 [Parachaetomium inaequale]
MPTRTRLAARPLQTLSRTRQHQPIHRPFSIMHNLRTIARSFEPHPFQRLPVASTPAPADWARLVRRSLGQAVVYFPAFAVMLGWPYAAAVVLDGRM